MPACTTAIVLRARGGGVCYIWLRAHRGGGQELRRRGGGGANYNKPWLRRAVTVITVSNHKSRDTKPPYLTKKIKFTFGLSATAFV